MIKKVRDLPFAVHTLYEVDGKEIWHCAFKDENHPVNRLWRMSGQPEERRNESR